ncbi:MAG: pyruvate carboxylase [Cytophagales bacterium]|nr:pyruvate carboxylase [Cytophagales bacterium]
MKIKKILVANRGEIAIRIFRACVEIGLKTVAIYTYEDRYSQHRYKADESYQVGKDNEPLKPYLDIDEIINIAREKNVDAIHPGYGFLSENSRFASKCEENGIIFIGPRPEVISALGDKISARKIAKQNNIPVIEGNAGDLKDAAAALKEAQRIGFPVMLKATAGGGGRGMRVVRNKEEMENAFYEAQREALNAFGDGTLLIEKFIENPKHIEVQIVGDNYGNIVHLFERDCSVQRRFQKVTEFAPSFGLEQNIKDELYEYALKIARAVNYNNAGTVEFLVNKGNRGNKGIGEEWSSSRQSAVSSQQSAVGKEQSASNIYFIEVNPRIQVEHTVTEMVTGIDLIKTQIFIAGGYKLQDKQIKIPNQGSVTTNGYAIQCRITTEDPENDFKPDYGTIITYRSAAGFGIRLDVGSIYQGVKISPFFDSLLVKVSAHSRTLDGACRRMNRALQEFRIRGVKLNIQFLENIVNHKIFREGKATVNFINENKELFKWDKRLDRATKIVKYLGDIIVNNNPDVKYIDKNKQFHAPEVPPYKHYQQYPKGTKDLLTKLGADKFSKWLKDEKKIHYTDTTFRDAHQSLLATRMRTYDMLKVAESFAKNHPQTFSLEVWGGATFDVCLRFLYENPWKRLADLRKAIPNILLQMLIRGSNGVGYSAYPDNLIESFVEKSWETGVDIFRIFDSMNWMENIAPCIRYVRKRTGGIAEGAICYTGDILDVNKTKYSLKYYLQVAKEMEDAGAHILAIKDMSGLLKPYAATELVTALKETVKIPIHLHTHDTSSLQAATYLKAIEAGVDVVDVALGGLSGLTSQPNFNSIVEMMQFHKRENKFDITSLNKFSNYWETVREYYYPFESGLKASTAEVFIHEIPGGQYSNLKPQATALGLGDKFGRIKEAYAEVNELFGNVIKVTPSSKVVGDMALYMVSNGLTKEDILQKGESISFPESVQSFFMGDIGQPVNGFPKKLQKLVLKDKKPYKNRPNAHLQPVDIKKEFAEFLKKFQPDFDRELVFTDFLSHKLYPKVYEASLKKHMEFGDISKIPTTNFFFGMQPNEETIIEIAEGKAIVVKLLSVGPPNEEGNRTVFFKVNGQTRNIEVHDRSLEVEKVENLKIEPGDPRQIGTPLQGMLSKIFVKNGQKVKKNEPLFIIEAMKMETIITAPGSIKIKAVNLKEGAMVNADDLVVSLE